MNLLLVGFLLFSIFMASDAKASPRASPPCDQLQCEKECESKGDPIVGGKCQRVRTGEIRCMCHN
ncbi:unnamed protein product [Cylicocyclus nassatus]|uniref:Uncharacterized protein n=1 Tax=Cylicocyclus nassatus TaxID=53992 RepID=A0AA36GPA6_CYLNA|nr:unnamed protein product [Cylicocyclus nassatus]